MIEKQISVDELRVGMFLTGMDKPWWETPFLLHKFLLKTEHDIEKIKACDVRQVTIDLSRGKDVVGVEEPDAAAIAVLDPPSIDVLPNAEVEPESAPEEIFSYEDIVVLIADDDPFGRQILRKRLTKLFGCGVIEAEHGGAALSMLREQSPDLLILDLMMPVKDGTSVLTHIVSCEDLAGIPVIIHSAQNTVDAVLPVLQKRPFEYLVKPVNLDELKPKIEPAIQAAIARRRGSPIFKPFRVRREGFAAIITLYDFDLRSAKQLFAHLSPLADDGVTQLVLDLSRFEHRPTVGGEEGLRALFRDLRDRELTVGVCGISKRHRFANIIRIFGGEILEVKLADLMARY